METKEKGSKKIGLFLISQAITLFGSSLVQFALVWHISVESGSGTVIAISTIAAYLPQLIISLFAGVLADRYNRKFLIILADASIAIATIILMIVMRGGFTGTAILSVILAIRAIGSGIQSPAVSAVIPQITDEKNLLRVNSINSTIQSLVMLAAPVLAGVIMTQSTLQTVLMIDVVTAAIGIAILLFIKIEKHETKYQEKTNIIQELKEGLSFTWNNNFLRKSTIYDTLSAIFYSVAITLNVLFVTRFFGSDYSLLYKNELAFFIGMLAGGLIVSVWGGFKNKLNMVFMGSIIYGAFNAIIGFSTNFTVYLVCMFIMGLTMPCFNIPFPTLAQEKVEGSMLGRVFSIKNIFSLAAMMIGTLIFGVLADNISLRYVMIGTSIAVVIVAIIMKLDKNYMNEGISIPKEEEAQNS